MSTITKYRSHSNKEFIDIAQNAVDAANKILEAVNPEHAEALTELLGRFDQFLTIGDRGDRRG
jgi:hypothetical protein